MSTRKEDEIHVMHALPRFHPSPEHCCEIVSYRDNLLLRTSYVKSKVRKQLYRHFPEFTSDNCFGKLKTKTKKNTWEKSGSLFHLYVGPDLTRYKCSALCKWKFKDSSIHSTVPQAPLSHRCPQDQLPLISTCSSCTQIRQIKVNIRKLLIWYKYEFMWIEWLVL